MPQSLVLVGAGGLGRETLEAVRAGDVDGSRWEVLGFLDDSPAPPPSVAGVPVLGPIEELANLPDAQVVLCTARPDRYWSRKRLAAVLDLPGSRYASVIHPAASLAPSVELGAGSVVLAGVVATADVVVGEHVVIMPSCVLTHDDRIGSHATFGAGVCLAGGVVVGEGAYIGSGVSVKEGVTIGPWALVGMGAVVLEDVPAAEVWVGSPARFLRHMDVPEDVRA